MFQTEGQLSLKPADNTITMGGGKHKISFLQKYFANRYQPNTEVDKHMSIFQ